MAAFGRLPEATQQLRLALGGIDLACVARSSSHDLLVSKVQGDDDTSFEVALTETGLLRTPIPGNLSETFPLISNIPKCSVELLSDRPVDLTRHQRRVGSVLTWAQILTSPNSDASTIREIAGQNGCEDAFLMALCLSTGFDSAIIWQVVTRTNGSRHFRAKHWWGLRRPKVRIEIPAGRGVIGSMTEAKTYRWDLRSVESVYNSQLVAREGWIGCIASPLAEAGVINGAISLYQRAPLSEHQWSLNLNAGTLLGATSLLNFNRRDEHQRSWDTLVGDRLDRLQTGVEFLGYAHDLASTVNNVQKNVNSLAVAVAPESLAPGAQQPFAELIDSAAAATSIMRALNRLSENRADEIEVFDVMHSVLDLLPVLTAICPTLRFAAKSSCYVRASPVDLQRILVNLVSNARAWTKNNGGQVSLLCERTNRGVSVIVDDTGPGVKPEDLDKISDLFFTRREDSGGLGIGLFVVQRLAAKNRATFRVENKISPSGVKARLWLPCAQGELNE